MTVNKGVIVFNPDPVSAHATIAVTGVGRSGTTMVARVLSALGLNMGDGLTPLSHEDKEAQVLIKAKDLDGFASYCRRRDDLYPKWGFKVPALRNNLRGFGERMRSPRFIVIFRDIVSIAQRNGLSIGTEGMAGLRAASTAYVGLVEQIAACPRPILSLSYEKALQFPEDTVLAIQEFCELGGSITEASKVIANGDSRYLGTSAG